MTVRELICKLVELKFLGKITDETRILSYSDEFDSLSEVDSIRFISDDRSFKKEIVEADLKYYTQRAKDDAKSLFIIDKLNEKTELLHKLNNEWKNAIRIG